MPFTAEGTAFFLEAIFLGIYLYAWDRLPPRIHLLTGIPVCVAGISSAFFGFAVASVYAVAMLRGRRDPYHRLGFTIPFTVAAVAAPLQLVVGDWMARFDAVNQRTKLAAFEGLTETTTGAPLALGGIYTGGRLRYAVEIPNALSLLAYCDPHAPCTGCRRYRRTPGRR